MPVWPCVCATKVYDQVEHPLVFVATHMDHYMMQDLCVVS